MDIFARIDRIEDFVANSKRMPLSSSVLINEAEFYDILDDMRATLPNELKEARWVVKEKTEILEEARKKTEEALEKTRREREQYISETEIVRQAELERDRMLEEAQEEARKIQFEAEDFADKIFGELEASLLHVLEIIRRGREKLQGYEGEEGEELELAEGEEL